MGNGQRGIAGRGRFAVVDREPIQRRAEDSAPAGLVPPSDLFARDAAATGMLADVAAVIRTSLRARNNGPLVFVHGDRDHGVCAVCEWLSAVDRLAERLAVPASS